MPTPLPFGPPDFQTFLRPWSGRRGVRLGSSWPNGSIVHTQGCWDRRVRGPRPHQILADQLTLFLGGADHTHHITTLPSGYSDLPTALTPQPLSPHWILPLELPHSLPPPSRPSPAEHMETAGYCPHLLLTETFSSKVREPDYTHTWFEKVPPVLRPTQSQDS